MLGKLFDKILEEKEDVVDQSAQVGNKGEEKKRKVKTPRLINSKDLSIALAIFIIAMALRLYFLFYITDPQNPGDAWADDAFHHWMIAYLTQEIGIHEGFLRLWDFKGMEYFWGPLHPFLLIAVFKISGSISIVGTRLLSAFFGSLVILLLYLIIKKYWNRTVALAASLLTLAHPVGILDDTFGLLEPIGYTLLLFGILILEGSPFWAGVLWGLAATARAEAWLFGGLLLFLSAMVLKKPGKLPALFLGWGVIIFPYMKYLLDRTGNPIYPIWWNYLANARGVWVENSTYTPYQIMIRPYLIAWFVVSVIAIVFLWRKYKDYRAGSAGRFVFLGLGFANWAFISGFMGLTYYLTGFRPWFWIIRFFQFPYYFLGLLICLFLFNLLPKLLPVFRNRFLKFFLWVPVVGVVVLYQLLFWKPIVARYDETRFFWSRTKRWAEKAAEAYDGGTILVPEGYPSLQHALITIHGIKGRDMQGQMYDPFFYMDDDPYNNWGKNREKVLEWLKKDNIRLIVVDSKRERYSRLFKKEEAFFEDLGIIPNSPFAIYKVNLEAI